MYRHFFSSDSCSYTTHKQINVSVLNFFVEQLLSTLYWICYITSIYAFVYIYYEVILYLYSNHADGIICNKKCDVIVFLATKYIFFFIIIYHACTTFYKAQATIKVFIYTPPWAIYAISTDLLYFSFPIFILYFSRISTSERNNIKLKYDIVILNPYRNQNFFQYNFIFFSL